MFESLPFPAWILGAVAGGFVGSFAGVVAERGVTTWQRRRQRDSGRWRAFVAALKAITWPGSHCPDCRKPLSPWENIPIVSFLVQAGQCRHCHHPIPFSLFATEVTAASIGASAMLLPSTAAAVTVATAGWLLVAAGHGGAEWRDAR